METENELKILAISENYRLFSIYDQVINECGMCYFSETINEADQILNEKDIDVVIIDLVPDKQLGFNTLNNISASWPNIICMAASNEKNADDAIAAMRHGAKSFLAEPFDKEQLKTNFYSLLKGPVAKNKLHSSIAAGLIHDIKNSIHKIAVISDLLENKIESFDTSKIKVLVAEIKKQVEKSIVILNEMVGNRTKINTENKINKTRLDLYPLLSKVMNEFEHILSEKDIQLRCDLTDGAKVYADKFMLEFILRNLIDNAIKFSYKSSNVEVNIINHEAKIYFIISDDGIGMNKETCTALLNDEKIKPQTGTAGEKGSGMGLFLCKYYIEKHNSILRMISVPGRGSCFFFYFDAA